jgi:hypothetical protein
MGVQPSECWGLTPYVRVALIEQSRKLPDTMRFRTQAEYDAYFSSRHA